MSNLLLDNQLVQEPPANVLLDELKHSIRSHLLIMQGPSPQLAVFLVKVIDFLDETDNARRQLEMSKLAFAIAEAVALHVQQSIDHRAQQAESKGQIFPPHIKAKGDQLLVIIGRSRGLSDKLVAKHAVLREVAEALRSLSTYTKAKYPDLTDLAGNPL